MTAEEHLTYPERKGHTSGACSATYSKPNGNVQTFKGLVKTKCNLVYSKEDTGPITMVPLATTKNRY